MFHCFSEGNAMEQTLIWNSKQTNKHTSNGRLSGLHMNTEETLIPRMETSHEKKTSKKYCHPLQLRTSLKHCTLLVPDTGLWQKDLYFSLSKMEYPVSIERLGCHNLCRRRWLCCRIWQKTKHLAWTLKQTWPKKVTVNSLAFCHQTPTTRKAIKHQKLTATKLFFQKAASCCSKRTSVSFQLICLSTEARATPSTDRGPWCGSAERLHFAKQPIGPQCGTAIRAWCGHNIKNQQCFILFSALVICAWCGQALKVRIIAILPKKNQPACLCPESLGYHKIENLLLVKRMYIYEQETIIEVQATRFFPPQKRLTSSLNTHVHSFSPQKALFFHPGHWTELCMKSRNWMPWVYISAHRHLPQIS